MARRTRIEYSATHMMSEAQPRLSSTACSLMVNSPRRSNAMGPPLAQSACHQTDGQVLGTNLNSSESTRRFWRSLVKNDNFYRRGPVKVIEIIGTPQIALNRPVAARCSRSARFRTIQNLAQGPQGYAGR